MGPQKRFLHLETAVPFFFDFKNQNSLKIITFFVIGV
jgi:hypothetical protein